MLFNSAYFSVCLWLTESQYLFVCLLFFGCSGNLVQKAMSGGVNKQEEVIGSIMKHHQVSESFRKCQEAPGSLMKY